MTPENLERHIRLQPLYRKMMGEWQFGDRAFSMLKNCYGYYSSMVMSGVDEIHYFNFFFGHFTESDNIIRLPLPIDPVNPKRGLWGMVDWNIFGLKTKLSGRVYLEGLNTSFEIEDNIETALLKALCEQDGL